MAPRLSSPQKGQEQEWDKEKQFSWGRGTVAMSGKLCRGCEDGSRNEDEVERYEETEPLAVDKDEACQPCKEAEKQEQSISAEKTFPGPCGRPREKGQKNPDTESEKKTSPEGGVEARKAREDVLVRNDEVAGMFQHEERAMQISIGEINLERGDDLGYKEAEKKHGNGWNNGMMEFWNAGRRHRDSVGALE